jgi:hypothetical protein
VAKKETNQPGGESAALRAQRSSPREVQRLTGLLWRFLAYPKRDRSCTTDKT